MKATVIIPAYNAGNTIANTLKSLEKQSFKDFEVVVVDDGSKDNTAYVVKSFPKARLLQEKNSGPAVARNFGAKEAQGEILVFTDSDCVADKEWLAQMVIPFEDKDIAGVQGRYKSEQKEIVARFIQLEIEKRYEKMARQKYIDFIGSYSAAYRKKVFLEMNGFDESFRIASGEDTEFSYKISKAGYKMIFNQNAIIFHTHPTSFKKYLKIKFFRAFWRTRVYKKHKEKMMKDSYTSQMIKMQTGLLFVFLAMIAGGIFFPVLWQNAPALILLLILTALPFSFWAMRRDFAVGLVSPILILGRTLAFVLGLFWGVIKKPWVKI